LETFIITFWVLISQSDLRCLGSIPLILDTHFPASKINRWLFAVDFWIKSEV